jgi:endonuclease/exonuclease/phosphatase family metal-dependent hydrolase
MNKDSAIRIDHVIVSNSIEILDSEVIDNEETQLISDHFPIRTIFNIKR